MANPLSEKGRRFYLVVGSQIIATIVILGTTVAAIEQMAGGLGVTIAVIGGICLGIALLLGKALAADWLNLRAIRASLVRMPNEFQPGKVIAFTGTPRTQDEALTSPFGGHRCCAYSYLVAGRRSGSGSESSQRANSLQGFALAPTDIEGEGMTLRLRALPEVETNLREVQNGGEWGVEAHRRVKAVAAKEQKTAWESEGFGSLYVARAGPVEPGTRDTFFGSYGRPDELNVEEEYAPVDEPVCVIGTAEANPPGISGRRPRLGPNLIVYRGAPEEVLKRIPAENHSLTKALWILVAIAIVALVPAFLPEAWTSAVPGLRSLFAYD